MSRQDRLCKRGAVLVCWVHCVGLPLGTLAGFLLRHTFVCYSRKVPFSTRPLLENRQTWAVIDTGVLSLQVCRSPTPPTLHRTQSCCWRRWRHASRRHSPARLGRALECCVKTRQEISSVRDPPRPLCSPVGRVAGRLCCPVADDPGAALWPFIPSARACTCVSFLNRHLNFSCIYVTDLFTNEIWCILKTILNILFVDP